MKHAFKTPRLSRFAKAAILLMFALFLCLVFPCFSSGEGGRYALSASAASDVMRIDRYEARAKVRADRQIEFQETITMTALRSGSVFTRYLPMEGDRYYGISASCQGEEGLSVSVRTSEADDYLHVECELPTRANQTRTYEISYVMEIGKNDVKEGMLLDVIGYGWGVPLHEVHAEILLPAAIGAEDFTLYSGGYGATGNEAGVQAVLSEDGKAISLYAERLDRVYNDTYGEYMAEGITLSLQFEKGVLESHAKTRAFTDALWGLVLAGVLVLLLSAAIAIRFRVKREIVTVVNVKAPKGMDPMRMGKLLDGVTDKEDITSMLYYFAHNGYLAIDLEDEDDPLLIRKSDLPEDAPAYQKTLFEGLFHSEEEVRVSELKYNFYSSVEIAQKQVLGIPMYEPKSVLGYLSGGIFGVLYALLAPLILSVLRIGNGYFYLLGIVLVVPVAIVLVGGYILENYRYKWKKKTALAVRLALLAVGAVCTLAFVFLFADFLLTEYEKLLICLICFASTLLTQGAITRREKYCETLGDILGFKDFIVYTEEDKIKFMLEEDPQLYYGILPYAQVLGVTDEWESKFKNILVAPPAWCTGSELTVFDYLLLNRCLTRAMIIAITPPQSQGNGSFAGRSGGGGGFGGFGGGGHGGGGGGWR